MGYRALRIGFEVLAWAFFGLGLWAWYYAAHAVALLFMGIAMVMVDIRDIFRRPHDTP